MGAEEGLTEEAPQIIQAMTASYQTGECFEHISPVPIPSREAVIRIVATARRVLLPGYFTSARVDPVGLPYHIGQEMIHLFEELSTQVTWAFRHDCFRYELECSECRQKGREVATDFLGQLPRLRALLSTDIKAAFQGDPAAASYDEIIFGYPGLYATLVYRLAHLLFQAQVPLLPRIMTEHAHSQTGIDIHPGARIGSSFFIDHGTGVVIGATAEIGDWVRLYQGVTLGALSLSAKEVEGLRGQKRHPTIEDEVIIYSGATILGGETVIGARSIIGGNVWLTESVPPETMVVLKKPELSYNHKKPLVKTGALGG